jgi:hypothetical protein
MDWNSITTLAQGQGTVFWVATAAVSLGLTLLVVALMHALVQKASRRPARAPMTPVQATPIQAAPPQAAAAYATQLDPPATLPDEDDSSLVLMLRRLQQAGDRLEEIAGDREAILGHGHTSALKSGFQDVEYVFRASGS